MWNPVIRPVQGTMWAVALVFAGLFSGNLMAQDDSYRNEPGYYDFGRVPGIKAEPKVEVDLNPLMLSMVAEAANEKSPQTADILSGLRGVKLYVYEDVADGREEIFKFIDDVGSQLEKADWMRLIYVNSEDAKVRIHVRPGSEGISGLTIMVMGDDGEAVFMNIVGDINPAKLGKLAGSGGLGDLLDNLGEAAGNLKLESSDEG